MYSINPYMDNKKSLVNRHAADGTEVKFADFCTKNSRNLVFLYLLKFCDACAIE